MSINNFDQSSSGVNLDLSCFFDTDLSRFWFDETFHVLQYSGYREHSVLVYGMNFKDVSDFDFCDIDNYLIEDTKEFLRAAIADQNLSLYSEVAEFLKEVGSSSDTIEDLFNAYETYLYSDSDFIEFLQKNFTANYTTVESRGYSQGDYSEIIIPACIVSEFTDQTLETIGEYLQDEIDHLIWDAPLYCRIDINGDEFDFTRYMTDQYEYDPAKLVAIFRNNAPEDLSTCQAEYITDWLAENLPVNPDYK